MNPKIERVREDIKRTEKKMRELDEYLKSLRIREKQLCDDELIKVMRGMAGKDGDVIALLDAFQKSHEGDGASDLNGKSGTDRTGADKKDDSAKPYPAGITGMSGNTGRENRQDKGGGDKDNPDKRVSGENSTQEESHIGMNGRPAGTEK